MNIFYFFLLVHEDGNTSRVPQDLAVSVIENTQISRTSKKNTVNSCQTTDFSLPPSPYHPFQIATARDFFLCLEMPCISAQTVGHPARSISHLPSGVEGQMPHLRCAPRAMSLKGKSVWWCDNGTGKHFVEPAAFTQDTESISGHFRKKVNSNNSRFSCSQFTLEADE